ncbi:hypothetical protein ABIE85_007684 [Bradyrhizobium diazoefficiens]|jgi:hypothetical protein
MSLLVVGRFANQSKVVLEAFQSVTACFSRFVSARGSIRIAILCFCLAMSAIAVSLGGYSVLGIRHAGDLVARTFDESLMSINYARAAGLEDQVDNHWGELFKAAALSTFLAVGTELGAGSDTNSNDSAIIQALRHGASDSLNQTGQQVVRRGLNIQPTLTVRPGFPIRVIVNRDLILQPYAR